jgi:hypothetical protein
VLATIVNIYTVHTGKISPSNIAILAVMASFAIIFGSLALYSYIALLKDSEATQTTRTDPARESRVDRRRPARPAPQRPLDGPTMQARIPLTSVYSSQSLGTMTVVIFHWSQVV